MDITTTKPAPKLDSIQFSALLLKEEKYLRNYITKKLYNFDDADDAYQTTLMEAFKSRANYRGESTPRVWICGIANNIAIRFNKEHISSRNIVPVDSESSLIEMQEDNLFEKGLNGGLEEAFHLDEMCSSIERAIGMLDTDMKSVFTDAIINGESYQGVADKYSIPIGTVKSRIAKAREHLRATVL